MPILIPGPLGWFIIGKFAQNLKRLTRYTLLNSISYCIFFIDGVTLLRQYIGKCTAIVSPSSFDLFVEIAFH